MKPLYLLRSLWVLLTCCLALLAQAQMTNLLSPALNLGYQETTLNHDALSDVKTSDGALASPATGASADRTSVPAIKTIRYVKVGGSGNGSSWANASGDLQAMLNASSSGDEVWVAAGTYKPNAYPTGCVGCGSSRDYTFFVKDGVKLYGGFLGDETSISQRNFSTNVTTLSGDIGAVGDNTDNVYHVVLSVGTIGVTIDGFSIIGGNADTDNSSITINTFWIWRSSGGGIYLEHGVNMISNNTIHDNTAISNGGGIASISGEQLLTRNVVYKNSSSNMGGGIYHEDGKVTLKDNVLYENSAQFGGGYASAFARTETLANNLTFNNEATGDGGGGGINSSFAESTIAINNTFYGNTAPVGGGMILTTIGIYKIKNNIFKENIASQGSDFYGSDIISFSLVQETYPGTGLIINQDPLFVNPLDPDGSDNVFFTADDGLRLKSGSPALNSGTATDAPTTDILGAARPQGDGVDMGAYEGIGGSCTTPTAYTVTGTGSYCTGAAGLAIGLANSETGVTYQLKNGTTDVGTAMDGTGAAISFGNQTAGTYTVVATRTSGACTANMTGSATITANPNVIPTVTIAADPSGAITSGTNVTFTATISNGGTTPGYQWYKNNNAVGSNAANYSDNALANGDVIKCTLTSNATCASPTAVTSGEITMSVSAPPASNIRYVKPVASGTGNGSSWANASADIQAMINASSSGGEVWVAAGTYKPNAYATGCEGCGSSRDYTFSVKDGVKLYGGFFGDEASLSQRNFSTNVTTLSGDVGAVGDNTDNVYHVVLSVGTIGVTIDGFSITGGYADTGTPFKVGGYIVARDWGGGIYMLFSPSTITNNIIDNNFAKSFGGGIYMEYVDGKCTVTNNVIRNNSTEVTGGGCAIYDSGLIFANNLCYNNSAFEGGAVSYTPSSGTGGTIINNTFCRNTGDRGSVFTFSAGGGAVINNIFWDNAGSDIIFPEGYVTPTYSLQNQDPLFVNPLDPDGPDNVFFTADDGFRLKSGSPALNSGTATDAPTTDIMGAARPQGTGIDMGAYEGIGGVDCTTPTVYNVTGGGTYCIGATGKAVGLENSQTGVNYQLKKATVSVGDPIAGTTGSPINFGIQSEGTYTVVATDAATGACSINMTGSAIINQNSNSPSVSISPLPASICLGATLNLSASSSNSSQASFNSPSISIDTDENTYSWASSGGTFSSTTQYATFSSTNSGPFTFSVTVSANGCTATATATVSVNSNPAPNVVINPSVSNICINEGLNLTALNATTETSPDTYRWASSGGDFRSSLQTARFTSSSAGGFSFTVTATSTNGGCTATATASVSVRLPSASISPSSISICAGASIELTGGPDARWASSSGSFSSSTGSPVMFTSTSIGRATITLTTGSGECLATATATITIRDNPRTDITTGRTVFCTGETVNMYLAPPGNTPGAFVGYNYSWQSSGGNFTSELNRASFRSNVVGNFSFTVSVTSVNSCTATGTTTIAVSNGSASINTSAQSVCPGTSMSLTASGGSSYAWSSSGGTFSSTLNEATFKSSSSGAFYFTVTATNSNNCTATATTRVDVYDAQTSISQSPNVCAGGVISFEAQGGVAFNWASSSGGFASTTQTATFSTTIAGSYSFSVTVTTQEGCSATATATATVSAKPFVVVNATYPSLCIGQTVGLTADGGGSYSWSSSGGTFNSTTNRAQIGSNTAGNYTIAVTATSSINSCTNSATTTVTVHPLPQVAITANSASPCVGQSINLSASPGLTKYSWAASGGQFTSTTQLATFKSTTPGSFQYSVSVTDVNSCTNTATSSVSVFAKPLVVINPPKPSVCIGISIDLIASGGSNYNWAGSGGTFNSNFATATFSSSSSGAFTFTVTATNINSCSATATASITVNGRPSVNLNTSSSSICVGKSLKLSATAGLVGYTWLSSGGAFTSSVATAEFSSSTTGGFSFTVTATNSNSCTNSATAKVLVNGVTPTISFAPICLVGNPLNLSASGGNLYGWKGPNNFKSSIAAPSKAKTVANDEGIYSVTVTGTASCTASSTIRVYYGVGKLTATSNSPVCKGGTIQLTALAEFGASYSWTKQFSSVTYSGQNPSIPNAQTNNGGVYIVFAKGLNGCVVKKEVLVTVSPLPCIGTRLATEESEDIDMQINAYPNPVTNTLTVEVTLQKPSKLHLSLFNSIGTESGSWQLNEESTIHKTELNMSELTGGVYLLQAQAGKQKVVKRVVKAQY